LEFDNNENKKNVKINEDNISENSTKIEESNQIKLINKLKIVLTRLNDLNKQDIKHDQEIININIKLEELYQTNK